MTSNKKRQESEDSAKLLLMLRFENDEDEDNKPLLQHKRKKSDTLPVEICNNLFLYKPDHDLVDPLRKMYESKNGIQAIQQDLEVKKWTNKSILLVTSENQDKQIIRENKFDLLPKYQYKNIIKVFCRNYWYQFAKTDIKRSNATKQSRAFDMTHSIPYHNLLEKIKQKANISYTPLCIFQPITKITFTQLPLGLGFRNSSLLINMCHIPLHLDVRSKSTSFHREVLLEANGGMIKFFSDHEIMLKHTSENNTGYVVLFTEMDFFTTSKKQDNVTSSISKENVHEKDKNIITETETDNVNDEKNSNNDMDCEEIVQENIAINDDHEIDLNTTVISQPVDSGRTLSELNLIPTSSIPVFSASSSSHLSTSISPDHSTTNSSNILSFTSLASCSPLTSPVPSPSAHLSTSSSSSTSTSTPASTSTSTSSTSTSTPASTSTSTSSTSSTFSISTSSSTSTSSTSTTSSSSTSSTSSTTASFSTISSTITSTSSLPSTVTSSSSYPSITNFTSPSNFSSIVPNTIPTSNTSNSVSAVLPFNSYYSPPHSSITPMQQSSPCSTFPALTSFSLPPTFNFFSSPPSSIVTCSDTQSYSTPANTTQTAPTTATDSTQNNFDMGPLFSGCQNQQSLSPVFYTPQHTQTTDFFPPKTISKTKPRKLFQSPSKHQQPTQTQQSQTTQQTEEEQPKLLYYGYVGQNIEIYGFFDFPVSQNLIQSTWLSVITLLAQEMIGAAISAECIFSFADPSIRIYYPQLEQKTLYEIGYAIKEHLHYYRPVMFKLSENVDHWLFYV